MTVGLLLVPFFLLIHLDVCFSLLLQCLSYWTC